MLYEMYERRINRIISIRNKIYQFRVLIGIMAVIFALLLVGFIKTKGIIYDVSVPDTYVYGDDVEFNANALFTKVQYEYSPYGMNQWTKVRPHAPGQYQTRLSAKKSFGKVNNEIHDFIIEPKRISVSINEKIIEFGNELTVNADLKKGDYISEIKFKFDNLSSNKTSVVVESIKINDSKNIDVTNCYEFDFIKSEIEFRPRKIKISLINKQNIYNGVSFTSKDIEVTDGSLGSGHTIHITTSGSQTDVGSSINTITGCTIWAGDTDVTNNYEITYETGTLEVIPRPITIRTESDIKVYDGTPLFNLNYNITDGSLVEGHKIEVINYESFTNVGTYANNLTIKITDANNTDVTTNYNITYKTGTLKVTPLPITIKTEGDTKIYDGTSLFNLNYSVTNGSLLEGHRFDIINYKTITDVGISDNNLEIHIFDEENNNITSNYDITYETGTLEVTPLPITVTTDNGSKVYDGTPLSNLNYNVTDGVLVQGHSIDIINHETITNVGTKANNLQIRIYDTYNDNVTDNYDITYETGTLEVTPRPITFKPADVTKAYDGKPLTTQNPSIIDGTLVGGHTIEISTIGSQTNVGSSTNTIINYVIWSESTDVTRNYHITYETGTLEVIPRPITVKPTDVTKVYDGTSLTSNVAESVIKSDLVNGHTIEITTIGSQTNAGSGINTITSCTIWDGDTDVTSNYHITYETGILEVTPRPITVKPTDVTKVYDGTPLTNQHFKIIDGTLVGEHTIEITAIGSQTNAGSSLNTITDASIWDGDTDVTNNYNITYVTGILEITPRPITVKPTNDTKIYDGTPLTNQNPEIIDGTLIGEHSIEITTIGSQTNVGSSTNIIVDSRIWDGMSDVTKNYKIIYETGTLEVTQRSVTVKPTDVTKVYDGKPLTNRDYEIIAGSIVSGHTVEIMTTGSQTNVGSSINMINGSRIWDGTTNVTGNYSITYETGTLEVTPRPITVKPTDVIKVYDGKPLTAQSHKIVAGTIVSGHTVKITTIGSQTNVGNSTSTITSCTIWDGSTNVTGNYSITYETGTLEVTHRPITVKAVDDTRVYDATPLTNQNYEIINGSIVNGHTLEITIIGSQTNVGSSYNTITDFNIWDGDTDVTDNYQINIETGTLEVTPRPITIRTASDSKIYDGDTLFNLNYNIIVGSLVNGHKTDIISYETITDVGTIANNLDIHIYDTYNTDLTYNYEITYDEGILEITPRPITIKTDSDSKIYDGTPLYNINYNIINGSLVGSHNINIINYAGITDVGICDNNIVIQIYNTEHIDVINNYEITYITGTLEVTPRPITINTGSDSKIYDGTPLFYTNYSVTIGSLAEGHNINIINYETITNVGTKANNLEILIYDSYHNDVSDNYDITYETGTLEVTHRPITVKPTNVIKVYDGTPLTNQNPEIIDGTLVGGHTIEITTIGSQTNVGVNTNTITSSTIWDGSTDVTGNYTINYETGTLEVIPRPITVKAVDDTKVYDGTPLTNSNYEIISGSIVDGHTVEITIIGSQTDIGSSYNTITDFNIWNGDTDVTNNYQITIETGILEVTPILIEFQVYDISKVYDGTFIKHDINDYWIRTNNLPSNYTVNIDIIGQRKDVGRTETYIDETTIRIYDEKGLDVTHMYDIVCYPGSIEVLQREITVTSFSAQKYYDGTPLTSNIYYITKGRLAENENITVNITGIIEEVGTTNNTIESVIITDIEGLDVTDNYKINKVEGKLTILAE